MLGVGQQPVPQPPVPQQPQPQPQPQQVAVGQPSYAGPVSTMSPPINEQRKQEMRARGVRGPPASPQGEPQNLQYYNASNKPGSYGQPHIGDDLPETWGNKAFADTVIDKLGPDMVYKMTPHQIGTLSAYMYLKLS